MTAPLPSPVETTPASRDRSSNACVVLASAGTGKTFQLTNRYIALLARGVDPASILATTFTRKAAGEILDRVMGRLARAAADNRALEELRAHADPSLTADRCRSLLLSLVQNLHRLHIKTLDSFFSWISAGFGADLGMPPGWRIVDEVEDAELRIAAIADVLASDSAGRTGDGPARERLRTLLEALAKGHGRSVHDAVLNAVSAARDAYLLAEGRAEPWSRYGPLTDPLDADTLAPLVTALESCDLPRTKKGDVSKVWLKARNTLLTTLSAGDWEGLLDLTLIQRVAAGDAAYSGQPIPPQIADTLRPLIDHAAAVVLTGFRNRNIAVHEFTARFEDAYACRKDARAAYTFDDIPRRITAGPFDGKLDHIYYRLDARLKHILLDEFQDTSLLQFALLRPILDELLSQDDPERSVFVVGDVKQSLYTWRGAEPDLLPALPTIWTTLGSLSLQKNFRSSPAVLDTVNAVFPALTAHSGLATSPSARRWAETYKPHVAADTARAGAVRLLATPDDPDTPAPAGRAAQTQRTLDFAVERTAAICAAAPSAKVGVLVRSNRHIPYLIFELRRRGIPAEQHGGSPVTDSAPVLAALSLLTFAEHPGDTAAAFHVATSPLGPLVGLAHPSDEHDRRRLAADIRRRVAQHGLAPFLRDLCDRVAPNTDPRGLARFDALLDLADEFDADPTSLAHFVRLAAVRGVEDRTRTSDGPAGEGSGVSVMTIHKAKGLDFDAVILPELDTRWSLQHDAVLVERAADRDTDPLAALFAPAVGATRCPSESIRTIHPGLARLHARERDRGINEELCCLYVAMTRAVYVLEMIVPPDGANATGLAADLPLTAAGVLRATLAPNKRADPGEVLFETTHSGSWAEQIEHRRARHLTPALPSPPALELRLADRPSDHPSRLRRRTPSSLEAWQDRAAPSATARAEDGTSAAHTTLPDAPADTIDLGTIWRARTPAPAAALEAGSRIHAWFESVAWLDADDPAPLPISASDEHTAFVRFTRALDHPDVRAVLTRARYAPRLTPGDTLDLRREWPFAVRDFPQPGASPDARPILLTGQFDRVVIARDPHGRPRWAEIIDFKTDALTPNTPAFTARVAAYTPQLRAYRRAAARMLRLPPEAVTGLLVFTDAGAVVATN